jgi:hypothetical protein
VIGQREDRASRNGHQAASGFLTPHERRNAHDFP